MRKKDTTMQKIYNTPELTVVRINSRDVIATSPNGQALEGINVKSSGEEYVTDGSNTGDFVW